MRVVLFDLLVNNADRKGDHILLDTSGHLWSIDHGICFHNEYKLRTVIWDFAGEKIPAIWSMIRPAARELDDDADEQIAEAAAAARRAGGSLPCAGAWNA